MLAVSPLLAPAPALKHNGALMVANRAGDRPTTGGQAMRITIEGDRFLFDGELTYSDVPDVNPGALVNCDV